jgi:hypothetical protein
MWDHALPSGRHQARPTLVCHGPRFEDWELEVRLYQECRVVGLPEVWSHVRWIDDSARIGRGCSGQPRSRDQEIGLLRDRLTVIERSIRPGRLTADLARALAEFRFGITSELARLEAAGG